MRRGEIWWSFITTSNESGPDYRRPVLIIQSDDFNRSQINTVIAAVITFNPLLARAPGNVRMSASISGLEKTSAVNVSQVITLQKSTLTKRVGTLKSSHLKEVEEGLRLVLGV